MAEKSNSKKRAVNILKSPMAVNYGDSPLMRSPMALPPSDEEPDPSDEKHRGGYAILRSPMALPDEVLVTRPKAVAPALSVALDGVASFAEVQTVPPEKTGYAPLRQETTQENGSYV